MQSTSRSPGTPKSQFKFKAGALQRHSDNEDLYKAPNPVDRYGSITRKYKSDLIGRVCDQFNKVNPEFADKLTDRIRKDMNPDHAWEL